MLRQNFFVLLPSLFAAAQVFAVSVYEPFSYPVGSDLAGQGGWVLTAGTSPKVQAGTLAIPGLMPATDGNSLVFGNSQMEIRRFMKNEAEVLFGTPGAEFNGPYWYSLAFKVTDLGSLNTDGDFIAAFSSTNQTTEYGGRLYLRKDPLGAANGYNIGVSKDSGAAADIAWASTVYLVGQTNFVVCRYHTGDTTDDTLLWINPDPSTYGAAIGSEPPPTLTASSGLNTLAAVGQIVLHQASANPGLGSIIVDEIRVEGDWPDVTPIPLTMSITQTNGSDVYMSWGGHQNDFIQQATNLTPPVTWSNLNSFPANARINNWTNSGATSDPVPKFFRLVRWYAE
jgi:hypothetical protein